MRFGEFLLERGRVSAHDMDAARRMQLINNHLIGVLALDHGLIKPADLEHILQHQTASSPPARFGEVAIGLGYLSRTQLEELLTIQAENRLRIGDVLVLQSRLTEAELLAELRAYREYVGQHKVA
jgi:hypothetical protein